MILKLEDIKISEEYYRLVPPLPTEEYNQLKSSIRTNGLYLPIIINENGIILDGHHRFKVCNELKIQPKYKIKKFENKTDEIIFVGECNLQRRQLTPLQRIALVSKLEPFYKEKAKQAESNSNVSGRARIVADYIAGMTDRYAIKEYERIFDPSTLT